MNRFIKRLIPSAFLGGVVIIFVIAIAKFVSAEEPAKAVFVLFDISDSTKKESIRQRYLEDFKLVLEKINPGDAIAADKIVDQSITKSTLPVKEEFKKLSFFEGGPLKEKKLRLKQSEKKEQIIKTTEEIILKQNIKIASTDILSSLHVAERVFKGFKRDKYILVIMSDMIEESKDYNFARENLSEKRISEIIAKEKKKHMLPDLINVKVYVTGATAENRDRFFAIQNFWMRYFKECGASLSKENYGNSLLNFNE